MFCFRRVIYNRSNVFLFAQTKNTTERKTKAVTTTKRRIKHGYLFVSHGIVTVALVRRFLQWQGIWLMSFIRCSRMYAIWWRWRRRCRLEKHLSFFHGWKSPWDPLLFNGSILENRSICVRICTHTFRARAHKFASSNSASVYLCQMKQINSFAA